MSRRPSLSAHLTLMNMLVSGCVLFIAALAFFSYDLVSFRSNLIHALTAEAQIVGDNSVSAITFNDATSANATLDTMSRSPDVLSAMLIDNDGKVFAHFRESENTELERHTLPNNLNEHAWATWSRVLVAHRIIFQGKAVGIVYVTGSLNEIKYRARHYALISLIILIFCMLAALLISAIGRRFIAKPIVALADTALAVSRDQDFSVRASIDAGSNEIAVLVDAFNQMLTQIGERDAALLQARTRLEERVEERTAELLTANQELKAFSHTVAHDLRGPLDGIGGIIFLLSKNEHMDPALLPMLEQLRTSTANMSSLIDDLLHFASASTTTITRVPVDLTAMAQEIASELSAAHPERDVTFQISETPIAQADPGLMHVVLDNLLRNAWKYTSNHKKACIEFGAKVEDIGQSSKYVYFLRDDGAGFDPMMRNQLFQPFHRLHNKSEFPGTGIGLATVQRIIDRQNGMIWAQGAIEKGATFFFSIG